MSYRAGLILCIQYGGEMKQSDDPELMTLTNEVNHARLTGNLHKETIPVQSERQNEKTITDSLKEAGLEIDRVHIVKLERVIE